MDSYGVWLIRSRIIGLVGAILIILSTGSLIPSVRDWEYSFFVIMLGFALLFFGLLDAFGLIQRKKVLRWIDEHNRNAGEQLTPKKPWE